MAKQVPIPYHINVEFGPGFLCAGHTKFRKGISFFGFLCSNAWENSCVAHMSINFQKLLRRTVQKYAKFIVPTACPEIWQNYGQDCPQLCQISGLSRNLSDLWTGLSTNLSDLWSVHKSVRFMNRTVHKLLIYLKRLQISSTVYYMLLQCKYETTWNTR